MKRAAARVVTIHKGYVRPHTMTTKTGNVVQVAGHWDKRTKKVKPSVGDRYEFDMPDKMYGAKRRSSVTVQDVRDSDNTVKIAFDAGWETRMPRESLRHFMNDLSGRVEVKKYGVKVPEIRAVISGKSTFMGKGDDGIVFRVGDRVVKVSTTVPYHPTNPGHRTPEGAMKMLEKQTMMAREMRDAGVPGIPDIDFYSFGDKGFQVRDIVNIPDRFTERQLTQMRDYLSQMHARGYSMRDSIQPGLDKNGNIVFFDTGKADRLPENERERKDRINDDIDSLKRIYEQSGSTYIPDYDGDPEQDYDSMLNPEYQEFYVGDETEQKAHKKRMGQIREVMIAKHPDRKKEIFDRWQDAHFAYARAIKGSK